MLVIFNAINVFSDMSKKKTSDIRTSTKNMCFFIRTVLVQFTKNMNCIILDCIQI